MAKQKVLLPHNFADYDHRALDFVIRTFVGVKDIELTLFNVYTPLPEISSRVHEDPMLDKLKSNLNQLSLRIKDQEEALREARQNLLENGFQDDQVRYIYKPREKDTAGEIIDLAMKERFDMIVLNHKPGKITRFFTGSLFQRVVSASKGIAVCVVT